MARLTSADVLLQHTSEELIGFINSFGEEVPEIKVFEATPITKTTYSAIVRTALPSVGFRASNAGRTPSKSTLVQRTIQLMFMDATTSVDVKVLNEADWGPDRMMTEEVKAHLLAALKAVASQIWYGESADEDGFAGVAQVLAYANTDMVVNALGDNAGACSSLFAVRFGIQDVCLAWGRNGELSEGEEIDQMIPDEEGALFHAKVRPIEGHVGLQTVNYKAMGRICNLDAEHGLTDDLVATLLTKFPAGKKPHALFASGLQIELLRQSRTATNATGAPAPKPVDVFNVPLYETDCILDTEDPLEDESESE